jgi:hypothetical protein
MAVEPSTVRSIQSETKTLATNQNLSSKPEVTELQLADEDNIFLKEDAVGYREYLEGLDLEFSDKEVSQPRLRLDRTDAKHDTATTTPGPSGSMEDRSSYHTHLPCNSGIAIPRQGSS